MKSGRCIRCQCVKRGSPCTDCWPSSMNPSRCQNLAALVTNPRCRQNSDVSVTNQSCQDSTVSITHPSTRDSCSKEGTDGVHDSPQGADCQQVASTTADVRNLEEFLSRPRAMLKRIPRLSRITAARKLAIIINSVVSKNDLASWSRLLRFPKSCFSRPRRAGKRWKLSQLVNNQVTEESSSCELSTLTPIQRPKPGKHKNSIDAITARVSSKLEEADFRGAVRLVSSEDTLADHSDSTLSALRKKHLPPHKDSFIPGLVSQSVQPPSIDSVSVSKAIMSFPNGSGGGCDGLLPQHLKDLISPSAGEGGVILLKALANLSMLILEGKTPSEIRPILFGASLTPLKKKCGGIRPIAVGCTIRRLVSKCAVSHALSTIPHLLAPHQLGFGIPGGVEAAIHACRVYLSHLPPNKAVLKVDFENAFNSIRRDKILCAVKQHIPELLAYVHSAYSAPSNLRWDQVQLASAEGIQQGDPLGPMLFCLTIHDLVSSLSSEFNVFYLDDGTIGGSLESLASDLQIIEEKGLELGLRLNITKSELICKDESAAHCQILLSEFPRLQVTPSDNAVLLGSPLGDASMSVLLENQIHQLRVIGERLHHLHSHDALTLLRHSFAIPKLLHILRTSPAFQSSLLLAWDSLLLSTFSEITNISFNLEDQAWIQATLPVRYGGLGIRRASFLAPSAFLASAVGASSLMQEILPPHMSQFSYPEKDFALTIWGEKLPTPVTPPEEASSQKAWEEPRLSVVFNSLIASSDQVSKARLLAVSTSESGAWLLAPPISSLGLRMSDDTIRIAIGLRVGAPLCLPHKCVHCGSEVDQFGTHGLSCRFSQGRLSRHKAINDIIFHSLATANIPSRLEPPGLFRSDGKRPDGVSVAPWSQGKHLVWDATCVDTFCASNLRHSSTCPGGAAAMAESVKANKYAQLDPVYQFQPIAVETCGSIGPDSLSFLKALGRRLMLTTGEPRSCSFMLQRLSVAVQTGNATSILGSIATASDNYADF